MYVPSPEEIAKETAKLQAKWSTEDRRRRAGALPKTGPTIKVISTGLMEESDSGIAGWQYLTQQDLRRKVSHKKKTSLQVQIEEESDREPFQASVVDFG